YHQGETKNDPGFAGALAKMADVYINDAFAVSFLLRIINIAQIRDRTGREKPSVIT
ncbi:MAG: phosphoglycerate kinase, partial [Deltaproteobacteria bacterium]|nr:phosphoglycerate kinase [Deltaproteobacteria bacterium]